MARKKKQFFSVNVLVSLGFLGGAFYILQPTPTLLCICFLVGFVLSVAVMLLEDTFYPLMLQKEQKMLDDLEHELMDELSTDCTVLQDWAQLVVNEPTERIFLEIAHLVHDKKRKNLFDKMMWLLRAHDIATRQHQKTLQDQMVLDALGVRLDGVTPESRPREKNKLLALL